MFMERGRDGALVVGEVCSLGLHVPSLLPTGSEVQNEAGSRARLDEFALYSK